MDPKRVFIIHSNECFSLKTQQTPSDAGMMPRVRIAERLRFDHTIELEWAVSLDLLTKGIKAMVGC